MGIVLLLLLLIIIIGVFTYYALLAMAVVFGISVLLIFGLFQFIPVTAEMVAIGLVTVIAGFGFYVINEQEKLDKAERLRKLEEERIQREAAEMLERERLLEMERERQRMNSVAAAQAKPWNERSIDDWKQIFLG